MKKELLLLLIMLSILTSCRAVRWVFGKSVDMEKGELSTPNQEIDLTKYNIYTFQMCEGNGSNLKLEKVSEEIAFPKFTDCSENSRIIEETYLLLPIANENDIAIYITTFSHKKIVDNCGVFNCEGLKDKIFVEDIDFVYLGKRVGDEISFWKRNKLKNTQPASKWVFKSLESENLVLKTISLVDNAQKIKPQVNLSSLFSVSVSFKKQNRIITYGRGAMSLNHVDCYENCPSGRINIAKSVYENINVPISKLKILGNHFYFTSSDTIQNPVNIINYKFKLRRMPYRYEEN